MEVLSCIPGVSQLRNGSLRVASSIVAAHHSNEVHAPPPFMNPSLSGEIPIHCCAIRFSAGKRPEHVSFNFPPSSSFLPSVGNRRVLVLAMNAYLCNRCRTTCSSSSISGNFFTLSESSLCVSRRSFGTGMKHEEHYRTVNMNEYIRNSHTRRRGFELEEDNYSLNEFTRSQNGVRLNPNTATPPSRRSQATVANEASHELNMSSDSITSGVNLAWSSLRNSSSSSSAQFDLDSDFNVNSFHMNATESQSRHPDRHAVPRRPSILFFGGDQVSLTALTAIHERQQAIATRWGLTGTNKSGERKESQPGAIGPPPITVVCSSLPCDPNMLRAFGGCHDKQYPVARYCLEQGIPFLPISHPTSLAKSYTLSILLGEERLPPREHLCTQMTCDMTDPASACKSYICPDFHMNPLSSYDLVVVVSCRYFIPARLLRAIAPTPVINMHPSLLPKYRGASPIYTTMLRNEKVGGVSIIEIPAPDPLPPRGNASAKSWKNTSLPCIGCGQGYEVLSAYRPPNSEERDESVIVHDGSRQFSSIHRNINNNNNVTGKVAHTHHHHHSKESKQNVSWRYGDAIPPWHDAVPFPSEETFVLNQEKENTSNSTTSQLSTGNKKPVIVMDAGRILWQREVPIPTDMDIRQYFPLVTSIGAQGLCDIIFGTQQSDTGKADTRGVELYSAAGSCDWPNTFMQTYRSAKDQPLNTLHHSKDQHHAGLLSKERVRIEWDNCSGEDAYGVYRAFVGGQFFSPTVNTKLNKGRTPVKHQLKERAMRKEKRCKKNSSDGVNGVPETEAESAAAAAADLTAECTFTAAIHPNDVPPSVWQELGEMEVRYAARAYVKYRLWKHTGFSTYAANIAMKMKQQTLDGFSRVYPSCAFQQMRHVLLGRPVESTAVQPEALSSTGTPHTNPAGSSVQSHPHKSNGSNHKGSQNANNNKSNKNKSSTAQNATKNGANATSNGIPKQSKSEPKADMNTTVTMETPFSSSGVVSASQPKQKNEKVTNGGKQNKQPQNRQYNSSNNNDKTSTSARVESSTVVEPSANHANGKNNGKVNAQVKTSSKKTQSNSTSSPSSASSSPSVSPPTSTPSPSSSNTKALAGAVANANSAVSPAKNQKSVVEVEKKILSDFIEVLKVSTAVKVADQSPAATALQTSQKRPQPTSLVVNSDSSSPLPISAAPLPGSDRLKTKSSAKQESQSDKQPTRPNSSRVDSGFEKLDMNERSSDHHDNHLLPQSLTCRRSLVLKNLVCATRHPRLDTIVDKFSEEDDAEEDLKEHIRLAKAKRNNDIALNVKKSAPTPTPPPPPPPRRSLSPSTVKVDLISSVKQTLSTSKSIPTTDPGEPSQQPVVGEEDVKSLDTSETRTTLSVCKRAVYVGLIAMGFSQYSSEIAKGQRKAVDREGTSQSSRVFRRAVAMLLEQTPQKILPTRQHSNEELVHLFLQHCNIPPGTAYFPSSDERICAVKCKEGWFFWTEAMLKNSTPQPAKLIRAGLAMRSGRLYKRLFVTESSKDDVKGK